MRPTTYPTFVNLKDLQDEGESFLFSRQSGELNQSLADLIDKHEYNVNLSLRPMGNAFEITGEIATTMTLPCARCGRDTETPIQDKFQELIVVMPAPPKGGHSGHTGGQFEDGPFCNYSSSYQFDLSEFVHEHVAANEPYTPLCDRSDCDEYLEKAQKLVKTDKSTVAVSPFDVLKNLQLKPTQKG